MTNDALIICELAFGTDINDDDDAAARALIAASIVEGLKSKRRPVMRNENPIPIPPAANPKSAMALLACIYL